MNAATQTTTQSAIAAAYEQDGYFLPYDVVSESQARELRADLESAEAELADRPDDLKLLRAYPDRLLPSLDALIRHPRLIEAVSQILGPDLLVWNGGLFIKEANSPSFVTWHQDLTYWGLTDAEEVTAWFAFSPSTIESGAMRFIPGSHKDNIVPHADSFADNNLLSRGQEIAIEIDESKATNVILEPGQASLHHGHLFHSSGPNKTNDRRIGAAIRYIKPSMKQVDGQKTLASLVSGEDRFGHFAHAGAPNGRLHPDDLAMLREDAKLRNSVLFDGAKQVNRDRF